jgi:hypothetical protein
MASRPPGGHLGEPPFGAEQRVVTELRRDQLATGVERDRLEHGADQERLQGQVGPQVAAVGGRGGDPVGEGLPLEHVEQPAHPTVRAADENGGRIDRGCHLLGREPGVLELVAQAARQPVGLGRSAPQQA